MATRDRLDAFLMGRCVRRAILEEAFTWIPPPPVERTRGKKPEEDEVSAESKDGVEDDKQGAEAADGGDGQSGERRNRTEVK